MLSNPFRRDKAAKAAARFPLLAGVTLAILAAPAFAGECSNKKPEWIFCEDFEGPTFLSQWQEVSHQERKIRETNKTHVREGNNSLKLVFPPNDTHGGGWMHHWWTPAAGQNEVFMRWYVKYGTGFNYGGWDVKMAGVSGHLPGVKYKGSGIPDGTWFISRLLSLGVNNPASGAIAKAPLMYYYYIDQKGEWGDFGAQNRGSQVALANDRWYCLEMRVKPNTVTSSNALYDGEQTLWIDGVEKAHYSGIRWRTDSKVQVNDLFQSAWIGQPKATTEQYRWEDNYVVSSKRIGCLAETAPSAPTGLTVR